MMQCEHEVFVSFSSTDRDVSLRLCRGLEERGLRCWISARDIAPGEDFQDAIVEALESAAVMVLVFSANANNSQEIKKELALASERRLPVVPVRIEDVEPTSGFKYQLVTRQWIDLIGNWDCNIEQVAVSVRRHTLTSTIAQEPLSSPSLPPPSKAVHRLGASIASTAAFLFPAIFEATILSFVASYDIVPFLTNAFYADPIHNIVFFQLDAAFALPLVRYAVVAAWLAFGLSAWRRIGWRWPALASSNWLSVNDVLAMNLIGLPAMAVFIAALRLLDYVTILW